MTPDVTHLGRLPRHPEVPRSVGPLDATHDLREVARPGVGVVPAHRGREVVRHRAVGHLRMDLHREPVHLLADPGHRGQSRQVAGEDHPPGVSGQREGPLGRGETDRLAHALGLRPLGHQPLLVHHHVDSQQTVAQGPHRVVAGLELPRHRQRDPLVGDPRRREALRRLEHEAHQVLAEHDAFAHDGIEGSPGGHRTRLRLRGNQESQVGRSGKPLRPSSSVRPASTWCSWISLRSKPIREPAM